MQAHTFMEQMKKLIAIINPQAFCSKINIVINNGTHTHQTLLDEAIYNIVVM